MHATPTHYDELGGEEGIRALVDRFYDLMDSAPEAQHIRALHATSLKVSREKLRMFLTGWTGGPQLYTEKYGHPMLRQRHFPFAIGERERDEWLWCMDRALAGHTMPDDLRAYLSQRLHGVADHMRNQPDEAARPEHSTAPDAVVDQVPIRRRIE
jgi:hemoglobin